MKDVDKRQIEENERVGGGTFLSYVVPQLGSNRVRLEPKISSVSRSERCPCSPPLQRFLLFPCVVFPALDCPTCFSLMRCRAHARREKDREGSN